VPPRPHFGIVNLEGVAATLANPLTRIATAGTNLRS